MARRVPTERQYRQLRSMAGVGCWIVVGRKSIAHALARYERELGE